MLWYIRKGHVVNYPEVDEIRPFCTARNVCIYKEGHTDSLLYNNMGVVVVDHYGVLLMPRFTEKIDVVNCGDGEHNQ